jgi:hypothetical protein
MTIAGPFYSYAQLEYLWIANGGPAAVAPVAAAIATAESHGGAGSTNPTDNHGTQTSWGLWQISNGTHDQPVPNILDPNINATAAVAKYRASGWRPWGTYPAALALVQQGVAPSSAGVPAGNATGTLTSSSTTTTPDEPGSPASPCLAGLPSTTPVVGALCLLTKTQARALLGGGILLIATGLAVGALYLLSKGAINPVGAGAALTQRGPLGKAARTQRARTRATPTPPRRQVRQAQTGAQARQAAQARADADNARPDVERL